MKIIFYEPEQISEHKIRFVTLISFFEEKLLLVKHRERITWEFPGGHIEEGESCITAAKRELYEETGAIEFDIEPLLIFNVLKTTDQSKYSFAKLYTVNIKQFESLPNYEIDAIKTFKTLPENLTYKTIQEALFRKYLAMTTTKVETL